MGLKEWWEGLRGRKDGAAEEREEHLAGGAVEEPVAYAENVEGREADLRAKEIYGSVGDGEPGESGEAPPSPSDHDLAP